MGGGLLQLKRYGQQNEYLNGNPSMTYFKNVFKKHTHFSMEHKRIEFEGTQSLAVGIDTIMRCKIDRNGDLVNKIYFAMNLPDIYSSYEETTNGKDYAYEFQWVPNLGTQIIRKATLTIGGTKVSELYGQWIEIYHELFLDTSQKNNFDKMTGHEPDLFAPGYNGWNAGFYPTSSLKQDENVNPDSSKYYFSNFAKNPYLQPPSIKARTIYVPLPFWFSTNPGLALPLVSLQYHEVYIEFECRPITELYTILETKSGQEKQIGERIAPNPTSSHHHIGNFITSVPQESFSPDMTSLQDGTSNLQGWNQDCHVVANYIYLDEEERRKFSLTTHDYLIEQTNRLSFTGLKGTRSLKLQFDHPVKYLIWCGQRSDVSQRFNGHNNYTNWDDEYIPPGSAAYIRRLGEDDADPLYYTRDASGNGIDTSSTLDSNGGRALIPTKFNFSLYQKDIIDSSRLLFDGVERYASSDAKFHQSFQAFQHNMKTDKHGLEMYSFAIEPGIYNPSGTCNFSRIENVLLEVKTMEPPPAVSIKPPQYAPAGISEDIEFATYDYNLFVYAINYNVLRIQSGMASTVFAN